MTNCRVALMNTASTLKAPIHAQVSNKVFEGNLLFCSLLDKKLAVGFV